MTDISVNIPKSAINPVYLPYLDNQARTQIYFGGSSSGKSRFIVGQRVVYQLLHGGRNFLICRQTQRSIQKSVAREIAKVIENWGLTNLFKINKSDGTVTCRNGYQAAFAGLDDVEKLKSLTFLNGVLTDVVVEEATETKQDSIKQLMKRQRGKVQGGIKKTITLLFNPVLKMHWIYKEYFSNVGWTDDQTQYVSDRLTILKTTYKDNRFLEKEDIEDLENETDEYFYNVYTLGNWGVLGDVIFRNWKVADLNNPDDPYYLPEAQRTNVRRGGDFGFAGHPAAFGVSHYDKMRKRIYCYKELYETGLTNDVLAERVKEMGEATGRSVWDSAEPKSIQELRNHGVNAVGARKGKDSIRQGIDWLKQQEIIVDKSLINAQNELSQYHWKKDAGGNDLNPPQPVDKNNHWIDQLRYGYEDDMEIVEVDWGGLGKVENYVNKGS